MTPPKRSADHNRVAALLEQWLVNRADNRGLAWIEAKRAELAAHAPEWKFFTSFSAAPRFLGKADLHLSPDDLAGADDARPGWDPTHWSIDQAGRTLLALSLSMDDPEVFVATLDKVFSTADVGESVALYQSLPVLPFPERWVARAAEGIRTSITSVFDAVALDSPYPSEYLDDGAWNQMVLKAVFVGSPLHRIKGIDERANPELAQMLVDYARERRSASRSVTPELWRPVGPFIDDRFAADIAITLESNDESERAAAALALHASGSESAARLLETDLEMKRRVERGDVTWPYMETRSE